MGGTLSNFTNIDINGNTFSLLDSTGTFSSFFTMDTNSTIGKAIEMGLSQDLTNSASSSYVGFSVIDGTILQDYNNRVRIANRVPLGTYLFDITSVSQSVSDGSSDNHMIIEDYNQKGLVYQDDYSSKFTGNSLVSKSWVISYHDRTPYYQYITVSSPTTGDASSTGQSIIYTPDDEDIIQVFVNGQLQKLGDGLSASVDCYFSNDGGTTPLGLFAVNAGDTLYWNGLFANFELEVDDDICLVYRYKP